MVFPNIETIKREYTDKYVVVDDSQPELARFRDVVGQVKTVNMSGKALVEFLDYHLNIGWYDIDLDYLKVVDKPEPKEKKPEAKKAAPKPKKPAGEAAAPEAKFAEGEKKLSPLELARMQGPAGGKKAEDKPEKAEKPSSSGKKSTADILAAARGEKASATKAEPPEEKESEPSAQTEAKSGASDSPAKVDRSKMSVEDVLAAARAEKQDTGESPSTTTEENESPAETSEATDEETAPAEPPAEEAKAEDAPAEQGASGAVDTSSMSIDDILAYCREHDAG